MSTKTTLRSAGNHLRVTTLLTLALLLSACAGPVVDAELTVRSRPVDVLYGDQAPPPVPLPPPAAEPRPAFPGFITPPAPRPQPAPQTSTTLSPTTVPLPPVECPALPLGAAPAAVALSGITGEAPVGALDYRVETELTQAGEVTVTQGTETRRVGETTELIPGVREFNVEIERGDSVTTTTFRIDERGANDGVFITQIVASDSVATDAFTPAQPVKIIELPAALQSTWSSGGIDPLSGVGMVIHGRITGKATLNGCGTPVDSWTVEIGVEPETGTPSRITSPDRDVEITGTISIATQFGGLTVASDLVLDGRESGDVVSIVERATVNALPGSNR